MPSGAQPIEEAARGTLPATVAAMVELGADPRRGLDALLSWRAVGVRFAGYRSRATAPVKSPTSSTSCAPAGLT
jgi:uncharacterized protein